MSTKKLIMLIVLLMTLFVVFMRFTLVSIQKESLVLNVYDYRIKSERLEEGIKILESNNFSDNIAILLIDNIKEDAVIWSKSTYKSVNYNDLPDNIRASNSYFLEINNNNTILLNTDVLLGDLEERMVSESIKYMHLSQSKLNPYEVDYFPSKEEDLRLRYFRNMIIEELIVANSKGADLSKAKYFFDEWEYYNGNNFNFVSHYDFYEGYKEYYKLKVREKNEADFNLYEYLESKRNVYGFFQKEDEYKIIGVLLTDYAIKKGINLIEISRYDNNLYKTILHDTPTVECKGVTEYSEFVKKYNNWLNSMPEVINYDIKKLESLNVEGFTFSDIMTEQYDYTFKMNSTYYLYFNYRARTNKGLLVYEDYIIAHISPNSIEYFPFNTD